MNAIKPSSPTAGPGAPGWVPAQVVALRELSPTVREFTLAPAGGTRAWTVGSHLRLRFTHADGRADERRYSLVGLPEDTPGAYRIAVKRADPSRGGSAWMWQRMLGDVLPLQHPANLFELPANRLPTLLVAGGIGITPLVGMAQRLAQRGVDLRMRYAVRSEDEAVYAEVLRAVLGEGLRTLVDARGERLDLAAEIDALPRDGQMLVCGPVPLLHAVQAAWAAAGRAPQRLRFETFGNTGAHPAQAFTVRVPRHGLTLQVPPERSLLEVLEAAGLACLSNCRRGECGLCALDVLGVEGEGAHIDHRDVFLSPAEKAAQQRLCACVSRLVAPQPGSALVLDTAWRPDDPLHTPHTPHTASTGR